MSIDSHKIAYFEQQRLKAYIKELEAALRFYADEHVVPNDGPWGVNSDDFGNVARAALQEKPE